MNKLKRFLIQKYPILAKYLSINYGLLPEEKDKKDYVMGASNKIDWKILKPNSSWLPEAEKMINELQKSRYFDSMSCVSFALNNVLEMMHINKWGETANYSDRFLAKMSGTGYNGNSMKRVLETVRKKGCVKEEDWSWDREKFSRSAYFAPVSKQVINKGEMWLKQFNFGYDAVWANRAMMKEALKYSPLYVGGYAWYRKGMLYYSVARPNHCFTVVDIDKMIAYDSYDPYIKHLSPNYKLFYVKRIYLEKKDVQFNMDLIKQKISKGKRYAIRSEANGEFYKYDNSGLIHIKDIRMIADDIANEMKLSPENVNKMLQYLTDKGMIDWLSEAGYNKLIK